MQSPAPGLQFQQTQQPQISGFEQTPTTQTLDSQDFNAMFARQQVPQQSNNASKQEMLMKMKQQIYRQRMQAQAQAQAQALTQGQIQNQGQGQTHNQQFTQNFPSQGSPIPSQIPTPLAVQQAASPQVSSATSGINTNLGNSFSPQFQHQLPHQSQQGLQGIQSTRPPLNPQVQHFPQQQQQPQQPQQQPQQQSQQQPQQQSQQQSQQQQPQQQIQQQRMQQQKQLMTGQLNSELFHTLLYDFLQRRGTPIKSHPTINGKRVNLFMIYLLCTKMGGFNQLKRFLNINFLQQQQNPWSVIAPRIGVYEGANLQEPGVKESIDQEVCNCYATYILPYEEYNATPNGQRDLLQRRQIFQAQVLQKFQQAQQNQQNQQNQQTSQVQDRSQAQFQTQKSQQIPPQQQLRQQSQQPPSSQLMPSNLQSQVISPSAANNPTPIGTHSTHQSPIVNSAPTPQQRKLSRASNASVQNSPRVNSPYVQNQHNQHNQQFRQPPPLQQQQQQQPQQQQQLPHARVQQIQQQKQQSRRALPQQQFKAPPQPQAQPQVQPQSQNIPQQSRNQRVPLQPQVIQQQNLPHQTPQPQNFPQQNLHQQNLPQQNPQQHILQNQTPVPPPFQQQQQQQQQHHLRQHLPQQQVIQQDISATNSRQPSQTGSMQQMKHIISKEEASVLRNYVPFKRIIDTHGFQSIKDISHLGSEIEAAKPIYLFAPELGMINLQALTMAIKSNYGVQSGEVVNALNTLLVTTSDTNYTFQIRDCFELLDALSALGKEILHKIIHGNAATQDVVVEDVSKMSSQNNIDDVFAKYVSGGRGEDILYVVNSLTGEVESEDENAVNELFEFEELSTATTPASVSSATATTTTTTTDTNKNETATNATTSLDFEEDEDDICEFRIDDYSSALQEFKYENKHHFSELQVKSATDDQVLLIDELITITMILRNISFLDFNKEPMANNRLFKDLLFAIVKGIALHRSKFRFSRKRLCLLKDCLLMLDNIAFHTQLQSLEEAFLSFVLVECFGPAIEDRWAIPRCNLDTHSYFSFGIDALTKLLVREPYNRSLFQAMFNGTLNIGMTSSYTNNFLVSQEDQDRTRRLISLYLGKNAGEYKSGILLTRAFQLYMSIIPYDANSFEFSKFVFIRAPTVSQLLFGVKLIIDMAPIEDLHTPLHEITLHWILENRELILGNFARIVVALASETGKFPRGSAEHSILSSSLTKALLVVNSLVENALLAKKIEDETQEHSELIEKLTDCYAFPRIIPDVTLTLDTFLAPTIDYGLGDEIVRLLRCLKDLKACETI